MLGQVIFVLFKQKTTTISQESHQLTRGVLRSGASKRGQNMALLHLWQCRKWNDSLLTLRWSVAPQAATQAWEEWRFFYSFGKTVYMYIIIMQWFQVLLWMNRGPILVKMFVVKRSLNTLILRKMFLEAYTKLGHFIYFGICWIDRKICYHIWNLFSLWVSVPVFWWLCRAWSEVLVWN